MAQSLPALLKYHHLEKWTGGVQGIVINKPDPPFGLPINADQWLYFFSLGFLLLSFWMAHNLVKRHTGRAVVAIRRIGPGDGLATPDAAGNEHHAGGVEEIVRFCA